MVAASKGCLTCRRRKVRCDEAQPTCVRCQKANRVCLGYVRAKEPLPTTAALINKDPGVAVRSRSGCTTCKLRKLKCDEAWPVCKRCLRAGRTCRRDIAKPPRDHVDLDRITFYTSTSASRSALSKSPSSHPDSTWNEQRAVAFFHERTAFHISGCYNSAHRWFDYLLAVGESEPGIKHCVIALGSLHEEFEALSNPPYSSYTPLQTLPDTHLAVRQYEKALQLIAAAPSWQNRDTPLLACLLFAAFDSLRGRPEPALFHRCSGLRILSESNFDPNTPIVELMVCAFLHFDTENLELGDPAFYGAYGWPFSCAIMSRPLRGFTKLKEACEMFEVIFNRLLRAAKQPLQVPGPRSGIGPSPRFPEVLLRYEEWCYALDEYLRASAMSLQNVDEDGISDLVIVQLRRLLLRIVLHVDIKDTEMDFDRFAPEFAAMVMVAECFANGCSRGSVQLEDVTLPSAPTEWTTEHIYQKGPYAPTQCPATSSASVPGTEPPFSGPRRQFLGITASCTPIVPPAWGTIDDAAVTSSLAILSRLPAEPRGPPPICNSRKYARSTFSLAPGIVCPLYVVATHCRDPALRRRALALLERTHRKEGQWDSLVAATNARAIMEAEEARAVRFAAQHSGPDALGSGGVSAAWQVPDEARVREVEALLKEGPLDAQVGLKRFEWVATGDDWCEVIPGCTTQ